ncbi:cold shock domain-containing protein [Collimonas humicola]|uniref:cold shock domain-containing protein n=1 Tax=Collimonas humicola TaxID=2825886 RepID=UPI001E2C414B|nr:cold shock domain-containing protein [Collimonas humicola]
MIWSPPTLPKFWIQPAAARLAGFFFYTFSNRLPMRYQGKITSWKDGKGFGFVATNGKSEKAFVHIKAFADRERRPAEGDLISY